METQELSELTVGELVAKDFRKAEVFKKFGIDFCCGGKKSIKQTCKDKGVNVEKLQQELLKLDLTKLSPSQNFDNWDLDFLTDYIVNTHHKYIIQSLPLIFEFAQKVAKVHGDHNPETKEIFTLFVEAMNELNRHMMKEEQILFPYIKQLAQTKKSSAKATSSPFGTVANPVRMMEHEHDVVGDIFHKIAELSNNFTPPDYACNTYRVLYAKLKEFEDDLHQHIHLENNILFPKAIELEKELLKS